jgi:hypothetical protein
MIHFACIHEDCLMGLECRLFIGVQFQANLKFTDETCLTSIQTLK